MSRYLIVLITLLFSFCAAGEELQYPLNVKVSSAIADIGYFYIAGVDIRTGEKIEIHAANPSNNNQDISQACVAIIVGRAPNQRNTSIHCFQWQEVPSCLHRFVF